LTRRFHQKAAFAAFFVCGDNAIPDWGISEISEFTRMSRKETPIHYGRMQPVRNRQQSVQRMLANRHYY
jgi:hypothetical protein